MLKKKKTWARMEVMCTKKEMWEEDVVHVVVVVVVLENGR